MAINSIVERNAKYPNLLLPQLQSSKIRIVKDVARVYFGNSKQYFICDINDIKIVAGLHWKISLIKRDNRPAYTERYNRLNGNYDYYYAHRMIMNVTDPKIQVDHINGDKLDNRRQNLRICTNAENSRNVGPTSVNTSGFKGVSFRKDTKKWTARICVDYKQKRLGCFDTPEEAAMAYNEAAKKLHGEFAFLNEVKNGN